MRPLGRGRELLPGVRVVELLNRSNVLDVYTAHDEARDCDVVVKTLRPDRLRSRRHADALVREGRLLMRFAHPHLVRAYAVQRTPRPAVVLETLSGETVGHLVRRRDDRRLAAGEVAHLGLHLCSALHYLHGQGLLHLDLKGSNVIADAGRAKVIDLSLARPPGRVPAGRGTWSNMAPEQARGGEVTAAADVFGLGTVLWEAAAGDPAFVDDAGLDRPTATIRAEPIGAYRRLPAAMARVVDASLEMDAADRPTLAEVRAVLADVADPAEPVPAPG